MSYIKIAELIRGYLRKEGLNTSESSGDGCSCFGGSFCGFDAPHDTLNFSLIAENDVIRICVDSPISAIGHESSMAEFITRVNFDLRFGRFEMSFESGLMRFVSCLNAFDVSVDEIRSTISDRLFTAVVMVDRFTKCAMEISDKGVAPIVANMRFRAKENSGRNRVEVEGADIAAYSQGASRIINCNENIDGTGLSVALRGAVKRRVKIVIRGVESKDVVYLPFDAAMHDSSLIFQI